MNKKTVWMLILLNLASVHPAEAQQAQTKIRHIGFLSGASLVSTQARVEAFRQGLRALGYVEGKNIVVEWRFAQGNFNRLPSLAADLVQSKVDAIV
ncbi:MAG TPA: ABC transporter substrate-binding protein, partial [Candidatus Binatia bacterium]